jgi:hypothetical protein
VRKSVETWLPGVIFTVLGIGFVAGGLSYQVTDDGRMAPGLMPAVMGAGLVVLGVLLVVTELQSPSRDRQGLTDGTADVTDRTPVRVGGSDVPAPSEPEAVPPAAAEELESREVSHPLRPWLIFATMVGALLLAPFLGLIPALGVGSFAMMKFIEKESWVVSVSVTVVLVAASWFIFDDFLDVNLPWGVFAGVL